MGRNYIKTLVAVLFLTLLTEKVSANCKAHDAEWIKGKTPKITIPHRSDPGKVLVDWTDAIENGRCADRFNVFVWETHRGEAFTKNYTTPGGTYSRIVELDPCVEYQFKIGFIENDLFGKERENSTIVTFKTEATPTLSGADKSKFLVQVYFDKVTQKLDYTKASIRFPKSLLQHTSCLKYIQADGIEDVTTRGSSRGYSSHFNTLGDVTPLSRSSSYSSIASGSSFRSSSYGSTSSLSNTGSYGSFGTSGSFGDSGLFHGAHKPSGDFLGSFTGTAGANTPMDPNNYHDGHLHHDHTFGNHGRGDFDKVSQNQKRFKRGLFGTTPRPSAYGNKPSYQQTTTTYKPVTGSTVDAKVLPPFLEDIIEIVVPVKPCYSYTFSVKFVSPQGATLGIVKDLKLVQLSEMHHYHPPTLTEIFKVGTPVSANAPFISLEPYSGVPVECVLPILRAVDRHMGHLEDELHYHLKKEFESIEYGNKMKAKFLGQKEHTLESAGCECSTPILHFNTTDPKQLEKHEKDGLFGTFVYEGMQNGKPYYRRPPTGMVVSSPTDGNKIRHKRFVGKVGTDTPRSSYGREYERIRGGFSSSSTTSSSSSSSSSTYSSSSPSYSSSSSTYSSSSSNYPSSSSTHSSSSSTRDQHLVLPNTPIIKDPPPPGKVYYVYWNPNEKSWWVGTSLLAEEPIYRTVQNTPAKCPGDTTTVNKWEAPHTFSWKVDPHMVMACRKQVY